MMAGEEGTPREAPADQKAGSAGVWSYFLVRIAILSVTGAFIFVMGLFAFLGVFNSENAANITAALGSLFGVVGTLVGAYFGIKASSDAQDSSAATAQRAVQDQKETAQRSVQIQQEAAKQSGDQILSAAQASPRSNPSSASSNAPGPNPMSWALAMLIPVAGCAGLLVLQNYLRRIHDAA